jgi:branched-chain amino acid transport system substrate-binding protein
VPATGTFAFLGAAQAAGVDLAVKEINESGGFGGAPVELVQRDSGDATTTTAEASFADLVTQVADVVVGPSSSVLAERLIPLASIERIPLVSPAATFPTLTSLPGADYFFRTIPSYSEQGTALGQAISNPTPQKVGLIYADDELGQSIVPTLEQSLAESGSSLVASVPVLATTTDLDALVTKVVNAKPDVVVLATAYSSLDSTLALISKLIAAGFGGSKLWLTTQNTGDYSQALPAGTLTGVNGIIEGYQPDDAFIARLKTSDSALIQFRYAAESYDATILAALAAVVAGDDSGPAIAAALEGVSVGGIKCTSFAECLDVLKAGDDIDYDGVSGPVNFDSDGNISPAFYGLYTFNGENKFVFAAGIVAG